MDFRIYLFMILVGAVLAIFGQLLSEYYLSYGFKLLTIVGGLMLIIAITGLVANYADKKLSNEKQTVIDETCEKYDSGYAAYLEGTPVDVHTVALSEYKIEIDDDLKIIKLTRRDNSSSHSTVVPVIVPH